MLKMADPDLFFMGMVLCKKSPLVLPHGDFKLSQVKYIAQDGDGKWYGYARAPQIDPDYNKEEWCSSSIIPAQYIELGTTEYIELGTTELYEGWDTIYYEILGP